MIRDLLEESEYVIQWANCCEGHVLSEEASRMYRKILLLKYGQLQDVLESEDLYGTRPNTMFRWLALSGSVPFGCRYHRDEEGSLHPLEC